MQVFQLNKNIQLSLFKSIILLLVVAEFFIQTLIIFLYIFFLVEENVDLLVLGLNDCIQLLDCDGLGLYRLLERGSLDFEFGNFYSR